MLNTIKNYLNPNTYNINIDKDYLYINNYKKINNITDNEINIEIENITLKIKGSNIKIKKILKEEILFKIKIDKVEFNYK